jgi:hypothetical protein
MTDLLDLIYQGGGDETPTRPKTMPGVTGSFKPVRSSAQDEMARQAEADSRKLKPQSDLGWGHLSTNLAPRQKDKQLGRDLGFSQDSDRTFEQPSSERPKTTGVPQFGRSKSKYDVEDSDDEMTGVNELLEQLERKHTTIYEKKEPEPVIQRAQTSYIEPRPDTGIATLTSQRSRIKRTISSAGSRPSTGEPKSLLKQRNSLESDKDERPDVFKQVVRETRFVEEVRTPPAHNLDDSHQSDPPYYLGGYEQKLQEMMKLERDRAELDRQRQDQLHKEELERREKQFEVNLQRERKTFDKRLAEAGSSTDIKSFKDQLTSQQDILGALQEQLTRAHQTQDTKKTQELDLRESNLKQQEQRLIRQAEMLEQDKQRLLGFMQQLEQSEAERRLIFETEQETLRADRDQLRNFQRMLIDHEKQRKSENAIERQKLDMIREQLEREKDQIQEELDVKEKDLSLKETLLEQKREELFRQVKEERLKLQRKASSVDNTKQKIDSLELEIMGRLQRIDEHERNSKVDWEKAERTKDALEQEKREFEETAQKVHMLSLDIHRETEAMAASKADIERERDEVEQVRYEAQMMAEQAKAELHRAEQARRDLLLQQRRYEEMRVGLVSDLHVRHKSATPQPLKTFEAKFEPAEFKRPQPSQRRSSFSAAAYLKGLGDFDRARTDFNSYITDENQRLLRTKLEMETGFSESLAASSRPPPGDSPLSSFPGDSSRFRDSTKFGLSSFARPQEKSMSHPDFTSEDY